MYPHRSVLDYATATYEINKSTFICQVMPVHSVEEAQEFIAGVKKEYFDARHNCSAYIIGENQHLQKANDDGEPSGTAGVPMLEVLKKQGLTNLAVVVTRYFGGIKLGAGGLIRAYGKAVTMGLDAAVTVDYQIQQIYELTLDYSLVGTVENYIHQEAITVLDKEYTDVVKFKIALPLGEEKPLEDLKDLSAGRIKCETLEQSLTPVPVKAVVDEE